MVESAQKLAEEVSPKTKKKTPCCAHDAPLIDLNE